MITLHKLTEICHLLNEHDVNYVVIGGCAIFIHGYERTTQDIDLLIDADEENVGRIKKALQKILPEAFFSLQNTKHLPHLRGWMSRSLSSCS